MTKYIKCGGGGLPPQVITDMNAVLNKKFSTSTTYPSTEWADMIEDMTELPEESASGSIAHFEDGADTVPIDSGLFYFNPVQASGTPTPSSPLPITGHTGINIYKTKTNMFSPEKCVLDSDNSSVYISDGWLYFKTGGTNGIRYNFKTNQQITLSGTFKSASSSSNVIRIRARYTDGTTADLFQYTTNDTDEHYLSGTTTSGKTVLYLYSAYTNSATSMCKDVKLELGTTATPYEAYVGTTYPVSWTSHGTVYGGYYNSKTGELWKTYEIKNLSTLTWSDYGNNTFYAECVGKKAGMTNLLMSEYSYFSGTYANMTDNTFKGANSNAYIYVKDNRYSTASDFSENVTAQVVYELATPVLVGIIDPTKITTYEGVNNIWNDGGGVSEVGYRADIDLYVAEHS